jgi:hypothetical protein
MEAESKLNWEELEGTLLSYGAKRYDLETLHADTEQALLLFVNYIKRVMINGRQTKRT